jgi:hypothetical protein
LESNLRAVILEAMKLRHAAALVTIGWYLMIPPGHLAAPPAHNKKHNSVLIPDARAPLNGWYPLQTFSTEILCHQALRDLSGPSTARYSFMKRHRSPGEHQFLTKALPLGQCIATDDPRIKGMQ